MLENIQSVLSLAFLNYLNLLKDESSFLVPSPILYLLKLCSQASAWKVHLCSKHRRTKKYFPEVKHWVAMDFITGHFLHDQPEIVMLAL